MRCRRFKVLELNDVLVSVLLGIAETLLETSSDQIESLSVKSIQV